MNHGEYFEKILNILFKKYNREFEIVRLIYEVDGEHGNQYRAICREISSGIKFVARYYLNGSDFFLLDDIDEEIKSLAKEPELVDSFCECLIAFDFAEYIKKTNKDVLYSNAIVKAVEHDISQEEIERGTDYCLEKSDYDVIVNVCVFADKNLTDKKTFEKNIVDEVLRKTQYHRTINIAYIDVAVLSDIKDDYTNDFYRLENRLMDDARVEVYSCYLAREDNVVKLREKVV